MSQTKTTYEVKEVCAWSENSPLGVHRYVHALIDYPNGEKRAWTMELPTDEAYRLAASSGNLDVLMPFLDEKEGANVAFGDLVARGSEWAMPGVANVLQALVRSPVEPPPYAKQKICIEVEMFDGTFKILDEEGNNYIKEFVQWANYAFPRP